MQDFFCLDTHKYQKFAKNTPSNGYCSFAFAVTAAENRHRTIGSGFLIYSKDSCSPKSSAKGIAPAAGKLRVR